MLERIRQSFQLTLDELLNKTTWPTWEELQSSAIVTLVASGLISIMVFLMDSGFENLFKLFYQITK
ncbi:MAG: preprotein translocase subunit SecE [Bacteroidetes bacterium]|nr:preprotein translocase subunit SecE [Bacteroidota bacterium]